jgi:hypothetical protein
MDLPTRLVGLQQREGTGEPIEGGDTCLYNKSEKGK